MDPLVDMMIETRALNRRFATLANPRELLLCLIVEMGEAEPRDLAEEMASPSPTISHMITELLRLKYIERVPAREGEDRDGRLKPVRATGLGLAARDQFLADVGVMLGKRAGKVSASLKPIRRANQLLAILD